MLDEPTNHLDLATKEMLLDSLKDFDGTMLFVSHDRAFLRGLSNRVLELGGESGTEAQPHAYPGSYVEYVERTGHEAPGCTGRVDSWHATFKAADAIYVALTTNW